MLENHISKLQELLKGLIELSISEKEFKPQYKTALEEYETYISDRPYWPLKDLISMYGKDLLKYASQALDRLPKEELDRSTRDWIQGNLVDGEEFNFDKYIDYVQLYTTKVDGESFLLSSLNGTIKPLSFLFSDLLQVLKVVSKGELASWVLCTEPDNAFAAIESIWLLGNVYEEANQLSKIEQVRGDSVQWGNCYQLLLPKSKSWMLLNYYHFDGFEISLHGDSCFIDEVLSHNKVVNSDAAKQRQLQRR